MFFVIIVGGDYYDLIVTGDLSDYGKKIMKELMAENLGGSTVL